MGADSSTSSSWEGDASDTYSSPSSDKGRAKRPSNSHRKRSHRSYHKTKKEKIEDEYSRRKKSNRKKNEKRKRTSKRKSQREHRGKTSRSDASTSSSEESDLRVPKPEKVIVYMLRKFPDVAEEIQQLLKVIDGGQAVDIRSMSNKSLRKLLKVLFLSLNLKEIKHGVFLLPQTACSTLKRVEQLIISCPRLREDLPAPHLTGYLSSNSEDRMIMKSKVQHSDQPECLSLDPDDKMKITENPENLSMPHGDGESSSVQSKRIIGPAMPSREVLAAAAKLAEAEAELREAELDVGKDSFIGPPPQAVVAEAASANEAERFEEVTRIMEAEKGNSYDVLGVNHKMSIDNIKKRYWKLSLLVHPDKCSHPQASQAFVILNNAFKDVNDPDKKKETDERIRLKEEEEALKAEFRAQREAAQWRRSQGITMVGDEELLAEPKPPPKRDEWMTTLPPERKPGVSMCSTSFSKSGNDGRGDTSMWTDSPLNKAERARINYLEAYSRVNEAAAVEEEQSALLQADLIDKFNQSKRSVSLVQKLQSEKSTSRKRRVKDAPEKQEEWVGHHPWKPWEREKDLGAGRQKVSFDSASMAEGLASRFSSGKVQRNFL